MLTKDQILGSRKNTFFPLEVPEWGGTINVRIMSGRERDKFEQDIMERKGKEITVNMENYRARLCSFCIGDDEGNRIFSDKDIATLGEKEGNVLDRIFKFAQKINGLSEKETEEIEKN